MKCVHITIRMLLKDKKRGNFFCISFIKLELTALIGQRVTEI